MSGASIAGQALYYVVSNFILYVYLEQPGCKVNMNGCGDTP